MCELNPMQHYIVFIDLTYVLLFFELSFSVSSQSDYVISFVPHQSD